MPDNFDTRGPIECVRRNRRFARGLSLRSADIVTLYSASRGGRHAGLMVLLGAGRQWILDGYSLVPLVSYRAGVEIVAEQGRAA
jgi:hypothetical protein